MGENHARTRRAGRVRTVAGVAITVAVAASLVSPMSTASAKPLLKDTFNSYPAASSWTDSQSFGPWTVAFAGYGSVTANDHSTLRLSPAPPASAAETHSALVLSQRRFGTAKLDFTARLRTVAQLRAGSPNPWETGWIIWDYVDNDHFSYLAVKTNGWELGKRDPAYPGGQRFLATGTPATAVGQWRKVHITRKINASGHSVIKASYGNHQLARFVDSERPYTSGKVGFYTEDATIDIDTTKVIR